MKTNRWQRAVAQGQRGMTLLEIMIVLAIIALVMGFLVGPRVLEMFSESEEKTAKIVAEKFAHEGFTQWKANNRSKRCPEDIDELLKYVNMKDSNDPWGKKYKILCGDSKPQGSRHPVGVQSAGPDGEMGNSDDIKSWE